MSIISITITFTLVKSIPYLDLSAELNPRQRTSFDLSLNFLDLSAKLLSRQRTRLDCLDLSAE